jgi:lysozyme
MKKKRVTPPKSAQKPSAESIKPAYIIAFGTLLCVFALLAYYKDHLRYYYAFHFKEKTKHPLKNSQDEAKRIHHIVSNHLNDCFGMDLSQYQDRQDINWKSLSIANQSIQLQFVILRASMGKNGQDKQFKNYWLKAQKQQLVRGAYHYYRPDEEAMPQIENYLKRVKLESGDLPPILDVEKLPKRLSKAEFVANVKTALKALENAYHQKPILYTYAYFYRDYLQADLADYPLWLANYNWVDEPSTDANTPYLMWQFTEKGIVKGIDVMVDLNVFNGNSSALKKACLK